MSESKCSYRIAYEKQKKRAERAEAGIVKANSQAEEFERRYYLEKNALEAAQSIIAELEVTVGRLREALLKVRPWFTPETMVGAGMIKIVDAALGE